MNFGFSGKFGMGSSGVDPNAYRITSITQTDSTSCHYLSGGTCVATNTLVAATVNAGGTETFTWVIEGGSIDSGQGTNTVVVSTDTDGETGSFKVTCEASDTISTANRSRPVTQTRTTDVYSSEMITGGNFTSADDMGAFVSSANSDGTGVPTEVWEWEVNPDLAPGGAGPTPGSQTANRTTTSLVEEFYLQELPLIAGYTYVVYADVSFFNANPRYWFNGATWFGNRLSEDPIEFVSDGSSRIGTSNGGAQIVMEKFSVKQKMNELVNGTFDTDISSWGTSGTDASNVIEWDSSGRLYVNAPTNNVDFVQGFMTPGELYQFYADISQVQGSCGLNSGSRANGSTTGVSNHTPMYFEADQTSFRIKRTSNPCEVYFDNILVRQVPRSDEMLNTHPDDSNFANSAGSWTGWSYDGSGGLVSPAGATLGLNQLANNVLEDGKQYSIVVTATTSAAGKWRVGLGSSGSTKWLSITANADGLPHTYEFHYQTVNSGDGGGVYLYNDSGVVTCNEIRIKEILSTPELPGSSAGSIVNVVDNDGIRITDDNGNTVTKD